MKQTNKHEIPEAAVNYAYLMWKAASMSINQATRLAAKQYKVNADELGKHVLEYAKNKLKENK